MNPDTYGTSSFSQSSNEFNYAISCAEKQNIRHNHLAEQELLSFTDGITDVSYGSYALLMFLSKDILEKLKSGVQ